MRTVLLGLVFVVGCCVIGCGPTPPPNDPPPPPQDSGTDKNKKALFPIPEESEPKEPGPKK